MCLYDALLNLYAYVQSFCSFFHSIEQASNRSIPASLLTAKKCEPLSVVLSERSFRYNRQQIDICSC